MRAIGLLAAAIQLALAALLAVIASGTSAFPNPPEAVPRAFALGILFAMPAVVGALGAIGGRRSVLAAAGIGSAAGSVIALSGATLMFLIPALLYGVAAGGTASASVARPSFPWRLLLFGAMATPVVVVAVLTLGIVVIPATVVMLLVIEVARGVSSGSPRPGLASVVVALAIACLLIGSGWVLLTLTETRCWTAHRTSTGIEYRLTPADGSIQLGRDEFAGGCETGEMTPGGAAISAFLAVGAIGVAAAATRRRP
jgi:hypothetical protein